MKKEYRDKFPRPEEICGWDDTVEYVNFIKSKPCLVCGELKVDAHHMEAIGMGSTREMRTKKDYTCVPLCRGHHQEYHAIGLNKFQEKYRFNVWRDAFNLLREWHI